MTTQTEQQPTTDQPTIEQKLEKLSALLSAPNPYDNAGDISTLDTAALIELGKQHAEWKAARTLVRELKAQQSKPRAEMTFHVGKPELQDGLRACRRSYKEALHAEIRHGKDDDGAKALRVRAQVIRAQYVAACKVEGQKPGPNGGANPVQLRAQLAKQGIEVKG